MVKSNEVAKGVRVKFNKEHIIKCLGDEYLVKEEVVYIAEQRVYNDSKGDYVHLKGESRTNSGYAYLNELDLEFPHNLNY